MSSTNIWAMQKQTNTCLRPSDITVERMCAPYALSCLTFSSPLLCCFGKSANIIRYSFNLFPFAGFGLFGWEVWLLKPLVFIWSREMEQSCSGCSEAGKLSQSHSLLYTSPSSCRRCIRRNLCCSRWPLKAFLHHESHSFTHTRACAGLWSWLPRVSCIWLELHHVGDQIWPDVGSKGRQKSCFVHPESSGVTSIHPSVYPSIRPSIHPSIHLSRSEVKRRLGLTSWSRKTQ